MDSLPQYSKDWRTLVAVLEELLADRMGVTEASRNVVALRHQLCEEQNELFFPFVGLNSETDAFPLGDVRKLWAPDVLEHYDQERVKVEDLYRSFALHAGKQLLEYAKGELDRFAGAN
jgi:hypothetical protein